jgi:hypothetical protein
MEQALVNAWMEELLKASLVGICISHSYAYQERHIWQWLDLASHLWPTLIELSLAKTTSITL